MNRVWDGPVDQQPSATRLVDVDVRDRVRAPRPDGAGWPGRVFDVVGRSTSRGVTWIWARDDLDLATRGAAEEEVEAFLAGAQTPGSVLVYVGEDRFVDLRGLRLLCGLAVRVRERGGRLAVVAPPTCLQLLVRIVGLRRGELPLLPTTRQAARWARR